MSALEKTDLFDRVSKKKQKNLTLSRELIGVLGIVADDGGESALVERAAWELLVDEHGEQEVVDAIERVQASLDERNKLPESKPYTLPV